MRILQNLIVSFLTWKISRGKYYKFRKWIQLESIKEKIVEAAENGQPNFPDYLLAYISAALGVNFKFFEQADWLRIVLLFYVCLSKSPIVKLPITTPSGKKEKDDDWSYEGRTWHLYSHLLASCYGWSLEYISQLQVREALATIQEILTDEQLEREFYHGLSEIAYPYDKVTKKSVYKPMERPHWMRPTLKPIPRFKIPKSVMPMGNVITAGVLSEEYQPKEFVN